MTLQPIVLCLFFNCIHINPGFRSRITLDALGVKNVSTFTGRIKFAKITKKNWFCFPYSQSLQSNNQQLFVNLLVGRRKVEYFLDIEIISVNLNLCVSSATYTYLPFFFFFLVSTRITHTHRNVRRKQDRKTSVQNSNA